MGERGLLILLLAGFCVPADNQIRKHVFVNTLKSWSEAQSYCREKHTDLATVRSQEEAQQLLNIAGASLITDAWIGLYRDGTQNWQWSNCEDVIYSWTAKLFCASINSVGQWEDRVCFEKNAFMCYNETSTITERYTLIEELKTWTEAQQYCREHHTDLVSIKNASENEDLVKKAQGKPFWIGLFNGPWKWSHQGDNYIFHYWNTGSPDNGGGNQKCVKIMKSGEWNDCDCISLFPFFCYDDPRDTTTVHFDSQSSPTTGPTASQTQDGGEQSQQPSTMGSTSPRASFPSHSSSWLPGTSPAGTGFCVPTSNQIIKHLFVNTLKSWSEAQSYCIENHTDLATVHSQEEAQQLLNIAGASLSDSAWIGLYRDGTQNWQWSNSDDVIYSNWRADLFCASVNSVGQWEDGVCSEMKASMCYQETSNITERYTLIEVLKTWTEAQQYCREHHTDLVSIKNASENADLVKKAQGKTFWLGLFNEPWKWSLQGDSYTFQTWASGDPDNRGGNENCVVMDKTGGWYDTACSTSCPSFCCVDGSSGQCFYEGTKKTWQEAQSYCRNQDRDLPTIQDQDGVNKLIGIIPKTKENHFWIGLHHDKENWQWSSGDDVIYSNWRADLFCASVNSDGEWEDSVCSEKKAFMCYSGISLLPPWYISTHNGCDAGSGDQPQCGLSSASA
ncbi:UNVERIFIED_CONTAM: hypothetical protein FKN15_061219 [Acipenser sinensis]